MKDLFQSVPQVGCVEWIGLRPARREPLIVVPQVTVDSETGLDGDRYDGKPGGKRMVTLIQAEHLAAVAQILGQSSVDPGLLRRNIVVSGINLLSLNAPGLELEFEIGSARLKMTGNCHPCSRMEENLGPGGYAAMRGHGGITSTVIRSGKICLGDSVQLCLPLTESADELGASNTQ